MDLNIQVQGLENTLRVLPLAPKRINAAILRSLNRTATSTRSLAVKEIRSQINLRAARVRKGLRIVRANRTRLEVQIIAARRPVLLSRFAARQLTRRGKPAGISVKVKPRGRTKQLRGAFFITLRGSGAKGIAFRRPGVGRLPVEVPHGPSVDQVFRTVRNDIEPEVFAIYNRNLRQQVSFEMRRTFRN